MGERKESWEELSRGSALQILSIAESNDKITLIEENLNIVLEELAATGIEKIAIVSVVGAFRAGKSFLLDVFLRYLRNTNGTEDAFPEDPNGLPEWLTCGGTQPRLTEGQGQPGFSWRSGRERTTTGMWMFSKPFVRVDAEGQEIAVLLMDTQGMFDMKTPPALTAAIFGLSTLISSYQIYNISRQIQEDTLQQLHFFTEFSLSALREYRVSENRPGEHDGRPFQTLDFLVRDWAHFDDNWSIQRCLEEMEFVLDDSLVVNVRDAGTREQIKGMFDKITCFLLPHPGTDMTKPGYKGDLSVIEASFLKLLSVYCHHVLDEGLVPKRIQGQAVSASSLGHYIRAFAGVFTAGQVPEALTLVQAMSSTTNLCAREKAHAIYKARMEEVCGPQCEFVEDEAAEAANETAHKEALEQFASMATFGKDEDINSARDELARSITETKTQMLRENKMKMDQSLVKYAPAVIVLILAIFIDKLSDYTCDWWLDACVQMSTLLVCVYVGILCFLAFVIYELKNKRGTMAATQGAMALGQASSRMAMEHAVTLKEKVAPAAAAAVAAAKGSAPDSTTDKSQVASEKKNS